MTRSFLALGLCLALAPAAFAQQKAHDPISLTVSPAKPALRPLQYRFQFEEVAKRSGNAADVYKEARQVYRDARGDKAIDAPIDTWLEGDLKDFPAKEVEEFFKKHQEILPLLEKAGRCDHCDWGHREGLRKLGFNLAIPEIQDMRGLVAVVATHSRLNLAKGKIDDSLRDVRLGLVMARHIGDSPLLISDLAWSAASGIMLNRLDEIIQRQASPSLGAALGDLPAPFISLRNAIEGERLSVYGTFPAVPDCVEDLNAGPFSEQQVQEAVKALNKLRNGGYPAYLLALDIERRHATAKKALIAVGRPKEKVDAMPQFQVALLHAFLQNDRLLDEMQLNQSLPPLEAIRKEEIASGLATKSLLIGEADSPAIPFARYFIPVPLRIERSQILQVRVDRRIAALRCVEAIRLYAGAHDGKLPPTLAAIKEAAIPVDPLTGKAFEYTVTDKTAVLKGTVPPEQKNQPAQWLNYEITIRQ